ncbi:IS982 family transposase, partial [Nocardiopsis rhodophaea]
MSQQLNALLTALYVFIDDHVAPPRTGRGRRPLLSDSELVTLAVAQSLLGFHSEHRWIRYAMCHLRGHFPHLPKQPGYNKRLRAAEPLIRTAIRALGRDSHLWFDNHWIADSTPVPCAMSRPAVKRSQLAGWANYGYCASHSRFFWGLRLFLVCTPAGLPILWALADPKADGGEPAVLAAMIEHDAELLADRQGLVLVCDKGFASRALEARLREMGAAMLRPSRKREKARPGEGLLKSVRQLIESVNDTMKGQLGLEAHGGRTVQGVMARVGQRILA